MNEAADALLRRAIDKVEKEFDLAEIAEQQARKYNTRGKQGMKRSKYRLAPSVAVRLPLSKVSRNPKPITLARRAMDEIDRECGG